MHTCVHMEQTVLFSQHFTTVACAHRREASSNSLCACVCVCVCVCVSVCVCVRARIVGMISEHSSYLYTRKKVCADNHGPPGTRKRCRKASCIDAGSSRAATCVCVCVCVLFPLNVRVRVRACAPVTFCLAWQCVCTPKNAGALLQEHSVLLSLC